MFQITKEFTFSASHQLANLPEGHPCRRLHGHNYRVVLVLETCTLDEADFVHDYGKLDFFRDFLDRTLDHQHLNAVLPINPTAENLAKYFYILAKPVCHPLVEIRVSETERTWASYRP